jgi:hypothetical protein
MEVVALLEFNQLNRWTNPVSSCSLLDCLIVFRNQSFVWADEPLLYYGIEGEGAAGAEAQEPVDEVEELAMDGAEAESSWRDRPEQQQGSCLPPTQLTKLFTHHTLHTYIMCSCNLCCDLRPQWNLDKQQLIWDGPSCSEQQPDRTVTAACSGRKCRGLSMLLLFLPGS